MKTAKLTLSTLALLLALRTLAGGPGLSMTSDEALKFLQEGNERFVGGKPERPNQAAERRLSVAKGQAPFATIIGCSDSRVPVEEIFDRGIGDVFVVRVAGNVCGIDEVASAEYGAGHLHTPLIVILGHTSCGAVTAVATGAEVGGNIPKLVQEIVPAVERSRARGLTGDALVADAVVENVWQSISSLFHRSGEIGELVRDGKVRVVGAVYDLADGKVKWLGPHPLQDSLLPAGKAEEHK